MIKLKVQRFGSLLGVVLPKEAARRLRASVGSSVFLVEEDDGTYRLIPPTAAFASKMAKADNIIGRYSGAIRKLAQS
ncbi:MAG: AbrB/MazE/SpoVT family DNA-binding domain-containing protein [Reyranellales bacterium]|jgi:antitoxin component of MazEF toxin-antitoxin module